MRYLWQTGFDGCFFIKCGDVVRGFIVSAEYICNYYLCLGNSSLAAARLALSFTNPMLISLRKTNAMACSLETKEAETHFRHNSSSNENNSSSTFLSRSAVLENM